MTQRDSFYILCDIQINILTSMKLSIYMIVFNKITRKVKYKGSIDANGDKSEMSITMIIRLRSKVISVMEIGKWRTTPCTRFINY